MIAQSPLWRKVLLTMWINGSQGDAGIERKRAMGLSKFSSGDD